jgi:hypothetical protein
MLLSPVGLRSEKGCAGDAQQKLKITDRTSRQRGLPTSLNPCLKVIKERRGENWIPDEVTWIFNLAQSFQPHYGPALP